MFVALKQKWYPPSTAVKNAFSRHADQLKILQAVQRNDPELRFLDAQIYPEWNRLMEGKRSVYPARLSMPAKADELRAGFYFCSNLLGLMESVYIDLNLEDDFDHPDNRGWMNLFKHWSWSTMFRGTYAVCCATYGARFQSFCRARLELTPGRVAFIKTPDASATTGLCRDRGALEDYLRRAQHDTFDLNFEEVRIIRQMADEYPQLDELLLLRLRVADPSRPGRHLAERTRSRVHVRFCIDQFQTRVRVLPRAGPSARDGAGAAGARGAVPRGIHQHRARRARECG